MPDLPVDYTNAITPTGATTELPATGPRGLNTITAKINGNSADILALQTVVTPPPELIHDFTNDPAGAAPATADTGQPWIVGWAPSTAATPAIASNRYLNPDITTVGASASYLTAHLTGTTTYMSAVVDMTATGTTGQRIALACWDVALPAGLTAATTQNSPGHVVFGPAGYDYGLFVNGAYTILQSHAYAGGSVGAVTQNLEVRINTAAKTATVKGADGVTVTFGPDPRIGVAAPYATAEVYLSAANTDGRARFQKFSAGTTPAAGGGGGGSITTADITDAGTVGILSMQATTQAAGRAAIGVGGATVTQMYANVVDYGADPSGAADCTAAFRSAGNVTGSIFRPIFIPQGSYRLNSTPFVSGALDSMCIVGPHGGYNSPVMGARLNLAAGVRLIDTAVVPDSLTIEGIVFVGGAGCARWTAIGNGGLNGVRGHKTITRCGFMGYTNSCISSEMHDSPYWYINDCLFYGANCTTTMGIALAGWSDNSEIKNISFLLDRIHVKIGRMGPNTRLDNLDCLRFSDNQGFPRVDIWFPVMTTPSAIGQDDVGAWNAGVAGGIDVTKCKFGNEFYNAGDHRILFSDEGTGTYVGDRFPVIANATGPAGGVFVHHLSAYPSGVGILGLVHSTTPNLVGMCIGPIWGSIGSTALLNLRNATGFNPALNVVGPVITMGGVNNTTLTTAQSGTLTGQCKSQVVA